MIKKKSFWLTLLAVLMAAMMVFSACGLVGCSSSGGGSSKKKGDGTYVFTGYTNMFGQVLVCISSFNVPAGTGTCEAYNVSDGSYNSESSGTYYDLEYTNADETAFSGKWSMNGYGIDVSIDVSVSLVDGEAVAADMFIGTANVDVLLNEDIVVGALESTEDVGSQHAQVVLFNDMTSTVVIDEEVEYGTWDWTDDAQSGFTVTTDSGTYTASVTSTLPGYDGQIQITEAEFSSFGSASNLTFLHMCDESLINTTLYNLRSTQKEGYTLVIDESGTYVTTIDGVEYTGTWGSPRKSRRNADDGSESYEFCDDLTDTTYTATVDYNYDEDGNMEFVFSNYYGNENVTFVHWELVWTREDSSDYQKYATGDDRGDAILIMIGRAVIVTNGTVEADTSDENEYWMFLYVDGTFTAHVYDGIQFGASDGDWTWSKDTSENLCPTFVRHSSSDGDINYVATSNDDGTWSVLMQSATKSGEKYFEYTFADADYPAGSFAGEITTQGASSAGEMGVTYYLVLYRDGSFKAHYGVQMQSDGFWANDASGNMTFYKASSGVPSTQCTVTPNDDGTISVDITNSALYGDTFTYIVDPSVVPVGGYDFSSLDTNT